MSEEKKGREQELQLIISPDLEYCYRDIFSIFGGPGEVIIEFGNVHRSLPNQATISNRIVLSVPSALKLQDALQRTLNDLRRKMAGQNPGDKT